MDEACEATKPFSTGLSDAERERLAMLSEECAEVVKVVNKILRHGFEAYSPFDPTKTTNREALAVEVGHAAACSALCAREADFQSEKMVAALLQKNLDGNRWLHFNKF